MEPSTASDLSIQDTILQRAWRRFALYDANAIRHQRTFDRLQLSILALGVLAVLLAVVQTQLYGPDRPADADLGYDLLRYVIIVVPIMITVLLAAANRFKAGNKWIMLRSGAEAIKREIYCYRARAGRYTDAETADTSRETLLAEQLKSITGQLMKTVANEAALRRYEGALPPPMYGAAAQDDGLSDLSASQYVTVRLGDQLMYFEGKTNTLERRLKRLQWGIYLIGGLGTLLAAVGLELWIALTTSLAAAFTTYLEYRQTEFTLTTYNQAATDLDNVLSWWLALSAAEQAHPQNQNLLVEHTEKVLSSELSGWVQQMTDALAELQAKQAKEAAVEGKDASGEDTATTDADSTDTTSPDADPAAETALPAEEEPPEEAPPEDPSPRPEGT